MIFPCIKIKKPKKSYQNSPKECNSKKIKICKTTHIYNKCKEISSCTFVKGSYTLEAAVIFPLVAGFLVSILFFFRVLQIGTSVQCALTYAGRMTAVEASMIDEQAALLVSAEGFFRSKISSDKRARASVCLHQLTPSLLHRVRRTMSAWVRMQRPSSYAW